MTATGIKMTADELFRLPDNGMRRELIAGELHEMPPAGGEHGYVASRAQVELGIYLRQHPEIGGGLFTAETGFRIARDPDTVRPPDLAYARAAQLSASRIPGYPELAPDLVVEVISPDDMADDLQQKVGEWLAAGVMLVWVLYPATHTAMSYRADGTVSMLHADDSITGEPVLPGFACRVGDLF